ncbi:MAG: alanine--tRNA ligase [Patescibacteria group bacterium]
MDSQKIRRRFLEFFQKRGHVMVPSSSLVPTDSSVLLTTAGMQQFKPYFVGQKDPIKDFGSLNTVSIQKSFRTSDIDKVGDETHLTFFEMLGNFSFGGYFKEDAIKYAHKFITEEMSLGIDYVSVFEGDPSTSSGQVVPADAESEQIWKSLGVSNVKKFGRQDNFWGPTGAEGPCGPTTEIYVNGVEVWNIVFNEYYMKPNKTLEPLKQKGVDTGLGLERLAVAVQKKNNVFETDLFESFHGFLLASVGHEEEMRIIADHIRATVFLLSDKVRPSNKLAGNVLRRLIRRSVVQSERLEFSEQFLPNMIIRVIDKYGSFYPELKQNRDVIEEEFKNEVEKFKKTLKVGIKEFFNRFPEMEAQTIIPGQALVPHHIKIISGDDAFNFHQNYGLTIDIIKDLARRGGHIVEVDEKEFEQAMKKHQEISRAGAEKKFGGHGITEGDLTASNMAEMKIKTRLHTATHLLNAALHKVLGDTVSQKGSDITAERTRFDFIFNRKMTPEEVKKVEDLVNQAITADYPVEIKTMPLDEAKKSGALYFYQGNFPDQVKVYIIADFSSELCGGPHVLRTGEIGRFRIVKEESSSAGIRRIRAVVE